MDKSTFDLDEAISEWRKPYEAQRRYRGEDIDELERHLRDETEALIRAGTAARTAFSRALRDVGHSWAGDAEYGKTYRGRIRNPARIMGELGWVLSVLPGIIRNYTAGALRSLMRHKTVSFINLFGLGLGIGCCILAITFIRFHLSWDLHNRHAGRIYRVLWETPSENHVSTRTSGPLGPALKETFPEVERAVRIKSEGEAWVLTDSAAFRMGFTVADPAIFDVFDYTLLEGDKTTVFQNPNSIVITESEAKRLFGERDIVGKTITVENYMNTGEYTITGVLRDSPENSSWSLGSFGLLTTTRVGSTSIELQQQRNEAGLWWDEWQGFRGVETFVLLRSAENAESLSDKLPGFMAAKDGSKFALTLQPLRDIHLHGAGYGLGSYGMAMSD